MFDIKDKIKVKVVTTWDCDVSEEDFPDEDVIGGDYSGVDVYIDGSLFLCFGDYYHDKGDEKASAVVQTLQALFGENKLVVKYEDKVKRI